MGNSDSTSDSNTETNSEINIKVLSDELIESLINRIGFSIVVGNEVGQSIVPENELARRFRDLNGFANQTLAKAANTVYLMNFGLPNLLKGEID